jgi:SAM-dependent methyltransferase
VHDDVFDQPVAWRFEAVNALALEGEERVAGLTIGAGYPDALEPARRVMAGVNGTVCDIGSGLGAAASWVAQATDVHVVAVEPEPRAAALSHLAFPDLAVAVGTAAALPLATAACAGACLLGLVSLTADLDAVLDEVRRVVQPGGRIALTDLVAAGSEPIEVTETGNVFRAVSALRDVLDAHRVDVDDVTTVPAGRSTRWSAVTARVDEAIEQAHRGSTAFEAWANDGRIIRGLVEQDALVVVTITATVRGDGSDRRPRP